VDADRGLGGSRRAGDETDARAAGEPAVRLRHVRRAGLRPAGDEAQAGCLRVEYVRDAERRVEPVREQLVGDEPAAPARVAHSSIGSSANT
jgi:hypothetical protein